MVMVEYVDVLSKFLKIAPPAPLKFPGSFYCSRRTHTSHGGGSQGGVPANCDVIVSGTYDEVRWVGYG